MASSGNHRERLVWLSGILTAALSRAADARPLSGAMVSELCPSAGGSLSQWLTERLPARFMNMGPLDLLWWQWLALPLLLVVSWGLGIVLGGLTRAVLRRIVARTNNQWDDIILERLGAPLIGAWTIIVLYVLLQYLGLCRRPDLLAQRLLSGATVLIVFWSIWRTVDVLRKMVLTSRWAQARAASQSLVSLGARIAKFVLVGAGLMLVLSQLGYPMMSLLAGLGIGGLALALAAQKTVENLFGAFALGVDQPFREGDFVKIEDFVGTVEAIGLRSTRVRTLDRTLISLPNGKLADMRVESFTARDRIRLAGTLGLVYDTTPAQMRTILADIEQRLRQHPKIWPDVVVVRFKEFGDSSLNIEIMAWFQTTDWGEFQLIRQELFLDFIEIVTAAGSSFAFPTRTVHLLRGSERAADAGELPIRPEKSPVLDEKTGL